MSKKSEHNRTNRQIRRILKDESVCMTNCSGKILNRIRYGCGLKKKDVVKNILDEE